MATKIRAVEYFYAVVPSTPGGGCEVLGTLAEHGVNLLASNLVPMGPGVIQLVLFPESVEAFLSATEKMGLVITGPQSALLVQGNDELGAVARIHCQLHDANVQVYAASAVVSGDGGFGYLLFVRPEEFASAARALGV